METTLTGIEPIPVEYVLGIAQTKATAAQRRPYIELIERWGDETGHADEASQLLKRLRDGQEIGLRKRCLVSSCPVSVSLRLPRSSSR